MKYYILSNSVQEEEIGHYMQTVGSIDADGYDLKGPHSRIKMNKDSFPDFTPDLRFELHENARLTDVISASNIRAQGFLINEKVKRILDTCNLIPHKYYHASVKVESQTLPYYWLHFVHNTLEGIDFEKSIFYETDLINKMKDLRINNLEDFFAIKKTCKNFIEAAIITLTPTYKNLDLFYFPFIHSPSDYFITEKIKEKLLNENVTGTSISSQNIIQ